MPKKSHHHHVQHIDKKLTFRLRIYFLISLILIGVTIYEIVSGVVPVLFALIGIGIGIFLGIITARMFHLSWSHDAKKIVSQLDIFGGVILVLYIIFAIFRSRLIGYFIHGTAIGGVSMAIVTGIMIGRVLGTRGRIIQILKEQNVF